MTKNGKKRLHYAEQVCAVLLHNNITHKRGGGTLYFKDNVLGDAMKAWYLATHPNGKAETDGCRLCRENPDICAIHKQPVN